MTRGSIATLVVPLVAIASCVAIPVVVSSGVGASVLVLGLGPPLIEPSERELAAAAGILAA